MANQSDDGITAELLLQTYCCGAFPMAESKDDPQLFWLQPEMRGVLPLDQFHFSKSLKKQIRQGRYKATYDTCFSRIMEECAAYAANRESTWINQTILDLYQQLHEMGHAHSVEIWMDGALAGGLYGVHIGGAFFGESMFHRKTNASKIALAHLVASLVKSNFKLLDTQFINDHLTQFGIVEIPRNEYMLMLNDAIQLKRPFKFAYSGSGTEDSVLQLITQTS